MNKDKFKEKLVDELFKELRSNDNKEMFGADGLITDLTARLVKKMLEAEMDEGLGNANQVPEDMYADAKNILDLIEAHEADSDKVLSYKEKLKGDLEPVMAAVLEEVQATEGTRQELAALQAQTRETAEAFRRDLIAFRATLRAARGHSHPDYQALRTRGKAGER